MSKETPAGFFEERGRNNESLFKLETFRCSSLAKPKGTIGILFAYYKLK